VSTETVGSRWRVAVCALTPQSSTGSPWDLSECYARERPAGWSDFAASRATSIRTSSCHTSAPGAGLSMASQARYSLRLAHGFGAWALRTQRWGTLGSISPARCAPWMTTLVAEMAAAWETAGEAVGVAGEVVGRVVGHGVGAVGCGREAIDEEAQELVFPKGDADAGWVAVVSMQAIQRCAYNGSSKNSLRVCEAPHIPHLFGFVDLNASRGAWVFRSTAAVCARTRRIVHVHNPPRTCVIPTGFSHVPHWRSDCVVLRNELDLGPLWRKSRLAGAVVTRAGGSGRLRM
jgi:hypothetical protein